MNRRALLVGIDHYDYLQPPLTWCADDALAMREVLGFHANHEPNFACHLLLGAQPTPDRAAGSAASGLASAGPAGGVGPRGPGLAAANGRVRVTYAALRAALEDLFAFEDLVGCYFSGHGLTPEH